MSKTISKTTINFWLDFFLLCVFLVLCWISIVLRYAFPTVDKVEGWMLWGLSYSAWTDFQFFTLCVLVFGILIHVMLHWTWVCGVVANWYRRHKGANAAEKQDPSTRTIWGVGVLIAICNLVGLGIAAAVLTIKEPPLP